MTRISASRDIVYSAPPGEDADGEDDLGTERADAAEPPAADD